MEVRQKVLERRQRGCHQVLDDNSKHELEGDGQQAQAERTEGLITQYKVDMVCVQETKLQEFHSKRGRIIWGVSEFEQKHSQAVSRGGVIVFLEEGLFAGCELCN